MHFFWLLTCLLLLGVAPAIAASGSKTSGKSVHVGTYTRRDGTVVRAHNRAVPGTAKYGKRRISGAPPSRHDHVMRSAAARDAFERRHPCPGTGRTTGPCPGYVVDHVKPLACGGPDTPENMQWQIATQAKAKDKWERSGCK